MAALSGTASKLSSGARGADTDTKLTAASAAGLKNAGYAFAIRYVSRSTPEPGGDLTNREAAIILNAGLALMAVQHVRVSGWYPSASLGSSDGAACAANCRSIGLPAGVSVWCDLEGVSTSAGTQSVVDYCNSWERAVTNAGYKAGLYVGANCGLSGYQLYRDLTFQYYWKSMSNVPVVENTGYQMVQSATTTAAGTRIDPDTVRTDGSGNTPYALVSGNAPFTCDTHSTVTIQRGKKYIARITCSQYPKVIAGTGGIVSISLSSQSGNNCYFAFTGIRAGSAGIYINNSSSAVFICKVV